MRRSAAPGASGTQQGLAPRSRVEQKDPAEPSRARGGNRGRGARQQRRKLEAAVQERKDIRNERNPLARRHMPKELQHIAPDELPARDWTRKTRVEDVTTDVERAYRLKRGEAL